MTDTEAGRRFSFGKKPIARGRQRPSRISIVHDYPPQQCDQVDYDCDHTKFYSKYKGILKNKDQLPDDIIDDLSFEYNYDEKIRAPRMSVVTMFKSRPSKSNRSSSSEGDDSSSVSVTKTRSNSYHPALYELVENEDAGHGSSSAHPQDIQFNHDAFQKRGSVVSQISRPSESSSGISPGNIQHIPQSKASSRRSSFSQPAHPKLRATHSMPYIKQINEAPKLPNYVPPVLRQTEPDNLIIPSVAPSDSSEMSKTPSSSSKQPSNSPSKTPSSSSKQPSNSPSKTITATPPSSVFQLNKLEPTHSIWKPNAMASRCSGCSKPFHLLRRRHHCRHCGDIFCRDCLQHTANLNILAKFENPYPHHFGNELQAVVSAPGNDTVQPVLSSESTKSVVDYSKYSRVCDKCYDKWLEFLKTGDNYETSYKNLDELDSSVQDQPRKASQSNATGVPSDWVWSSF